MDYRKKTVVASVAGFVKTGSMAGYLFQCLHCKKYHLWVDAD